MTYNFDQTIDRKNTGSAKWDYYGDGVLPMWVADMDFASPQPVLDALHQRIDHGVFGYGWQPTELSNAICERMQRLYNWAVTPDDLIYLPGLVCGTNLTCRATGQPGASVLVQTPVYPPFLTAPGNHGMELVTDELVLSGNGKTIGYEIDFDAFEAAIKPNTRLFILCNPHNPIGRGYTRDEQLQMAEICARHNVVICSDEIHSDLLLDGTRHTPMATLSPEIAQNTITLLAPSKTFNVPGLGCSVAIVQNKTLRKQVEKAAAGIVPHVNVLGYVAAQAAYQHGQSWLDALLDYLSANRDFVVQFVAEQLPGVRTTAPDSTYLAWLDCREAGIKSNPYRFFLKHANVALNNGADFGPGGEGFVRLNFGCPRQTLEQGLNQMKDALSRL
jgi:cystathionine beta-lyase